MNVSLNYGHGSVTLDIPDRNYMGALDPLDVREVDDPVAEVKHALKNPIGSKKLKELVSPEDNVVIAASDISRPAPSHILLPPLLEELNEAGVKDEQIKVIFGLGIHRKQMEEEKKRLVGEEVYNRVKCIDHDEEKCVRIGTTKLGAPVEVFKEVLDADFIIATGNLEFHYFAGFSGGAKAIAPGVCSRKTIQANHKHLLHPDARSGKLEGNLLREELEEMGTMIGIDFMVNAVLNCQKKVVKVVAGDVTKAHREGAKYIRKMFLLNLDELADIVVTSAGGFPKDIDLYQTHKVVENAVFAVKEGGIIIVASECSDGLGEKGFAEGMTTDLSPQELINELNHTFILGRCKAGRTASIHLHSEIYLISDLPEKVKEKMFVKSFDSVDAALASALEVQEKDAKVLVMPYGNATLPNYKG